MPALKSTIHPTHVKRRSCWTPARTTPRRLTYWFEREQILWPRAGCHGRKGRPQKSSLSWNERERRWLRSNYCGRRASFTEYGDDGQSRKAGRQAARASDEGEGGLECDVRRYRFGPPKLDDVVYAFWEKWHRVPGNEAWRALRYMLKDKKFKVDLVYADRFDETADVVKRRTLAAQQILGKLEIDYSEVQPKA